MNKYVHTTPANDWFFVHESPLTVHRLAVWATTEEGAVTGLIAVTGPAKGTTTPSQTTAQLVQPPPVVGAYKHLSSLSVEERELSNKW